MMTFSTSIMAKPSCFAKILSRPKQHYVGSLAIRYPHQRIFYEIYHNTRRSYDLMIKVVFRPHLLFVFGACTNRQRKGKSGMGAVPKGKAYSQLAATAQTGCQRQLSVN